MGFPHASPLFVSGECWMAAARDQAARVLRAETTEAGEAAAGLGDQIRTHVAEEKRRAEAPTAPPGDRPAAAPGAPAQGAAPAAAAAPKSGKRKFILIG